MSASVSSQIKESPELIIRRSANYHPSIWRDYFLKYSSESQEIDEKTEKQVHKLKEEVKSMLSVTSTNPSEKVQLIDGIQRLGISYHFEKEISEILRHMMKIVEDIGFENDGLFMTSLKFRLLRQEGYNISSDVFNKFKSTKGKFRNELGTNDVNGMLSLYEASHLRIHGEPILEEALSFTTSHLKSLTSSSSSQFSPFLASQVKHALRQPIWKSLPRVEANRFIALYQEDPSRNEVLLHLAKLDFNILQKIHQKELSEISRWWKDLDFASKLPFARDRLVECYFWILGVYFEPQYALGRKILTKVIAMTSVLDDIYDVYGTLQELKLFTDAFERWDIDCLDDYQLPECMKYFYKALLRVYEETDQEEMGTQYCVHFAKEAMKKQVKAYFDEAEWFHKNYTPTLEEYMKLALMSSGYPLLTITSFLFMGDIATEKAFVWASKEPKIVRASSTIARLMDDLVTHKDEQKRGDVSSSIECYMRQYNVLEEEAYKEFRDRIVDAWKDINEEYLEPRDVPISLLTRAVNLARVMDTIYKDEDSYTNSGGVMITFVKSLFIDPVTV